MVTTLNKQLNSKCCANLFTTIIINLKSKNIEAAEKAEMVLKYFKIGNLAYDVLVKKQQM